MLVRPTLSHGTVPMVSSVLRRFNRLGNKIRYIDEEFQDQFQSPVFEKQLTLENMNPHIKAMHFAIRGPLEIRAAEIENDLAQGAKMPFQSVIRANIGDAHSMGQQPITFMSQVLAACTFPKLLESPEFPTDVKERAKQLLAACGGRSVGSYSPSAGIELIRRNAAEYIRKRDGGIAANAREVFLTAGATEAISSFLKLFSRQSSNGKPAGVMMPVPYYPLYSASTAEFGMAGIGYHLNENNNWSLDITELRRAIDAAKSKCNPRVLCVINPGNPTGQVLSRQNMQDIIKFAKEEGLFLFADEVYQDNVYDPSCEFHSFKKVMNEMGAPYSSLELASFHSVSKSYMGACGLRGAYAEFTNVDSNVMAQYEKSIAAKICPTVLGQIGLDCLLRPPMPGDPSYELFSTEKELTLKSLADKANMVYEAFNSVEGIKCNPVQGSMYAFPRLFLPKKAIAKAQSLRQEPDFFYAMQLLNNTGICVVPGSGFGQQKGTYHFRSTILPPPVIFKEMLTRFKKFHLRFLEEYN